MTFTSCFQGGQVNRASFKLIVFPLFCSDSHSLFHSDGCWRRPLPSSDGAPRRRHPSPRVQRPHCSGQKDIIAIYSIKFNVFLANFVNRFHSFFTTRPNADPLEVSSVKLLKTMTFGRRRAPMLTSRRSRISRSSPSTFLTN